MSRWGLNTGPDGTVRAVDLDPVRLGVPDVPVPLPWGNLACLACGVSVAGPSTGVVVVEAVGREGQPPRPERPGPPASVLRTEFLRCPACADRLEVAHRLLDARPRIRARLGDETAQHQLECALLALAVLGHDAPEDLPEVVLFSLLRHLTPPGAARWLARFAPVVAPDAAPVTCSPYAWAHVRHGVRQQLRESYAAVLRDRVAASAPPGRLSPADACSEASMP